VATPASSASIAEAAGDHGSQGAQAIPARSTIPPAGRVAALGLVHQGGRRWLGHPAAQALEQLLAKAQPRLDEIVDAFDEASLRTFLQA
jgi:hypothetical protein